MYQSGNSNATTLTQRNEPEQTSSFEYENFKTKRVFLNEVKLISYYRGFYILN
jgi:hypothetical protein